MINKIAEGLAKDITRLIDKIARDITRSKKKPEGLKKFKNRPMYSHNQLEKAIAKQKEEDAKMCELFARYSDGSEFDRGYQISATACAHAIRTDNAEADA